MTDIDRALGRAWRDDAPWRVLTGLAELPDRLGGGDGERRGHRRRRRRQRRDSLDGAGRSRDLRAFTHASDAVGEVVDRVADDTGHPVAENPDPNPFSDHWPFLRAGVPSLQLHSAREERGRGWTHTRADTRDKVDRRDIRSHAMLTALLMRELAGADLPHVEAKPFRDAFREQAYESGMRAADVWPDEWT